MPSTKKGGTIEFAPIIASGLLLTAEELYRKMLAKEKKKVGKKFGKKGGMAELSSEETPVMTGGKRSSRGKGKKRGGNDELSGGNFVTDSLNTISSTVTDAIQGKNVATPQSGGRRRRSKKGGFDLEKELSAVLDDQTVGGGKKKRGRKPKRGGFTESDAPDLEVKSDAPGAAPVAGILPNPTVPSPTVASPSMPDPAMQQEGQEVVSTEEAKSVQEGGKGKKAKKPAAKPVKKAVKGKKKGGNDIMSLYSQQLNGLTNQLNSVVKG